MYDILKPTTLALVAFNEALLTRLCPPAQDPWLFTDPVAKTLYMQQNRLTELQHDITTHVMYNNCWAEDEIEISHTFQCLLSRGVIYPKGTFGYLSPHPTVYRVAQEEVIKVSGCRLELCPSDDVLFAPWVARVAQPNLCAPLHIGRLQSVTKPRLCSETFPEICHLGHHDMAILHHILPKKHR